MTNIILTAAGNYQRFRDAGILFPKYLLPWKNGTILSEILDQLVMPTFNFAWSLNKVYLVVHQKDKDYFGHIKEILHSHCIDPDHLIVLNETTGQAQTARLGMQHLSLQGPVVIHNVDTIVSNRDLRIIERGLQQHAGFIDVFKSNNHAYSYVLAEDHLVKVISEKVLISDLATSGLYGFSDREMYMSYCSNTDSYISEVYHNMLHHKHSITIGPVYGEKDTLVLGTPSDYLNSSRALI